MVGLGPICVSIVARITGYKLKKLYLFFSFLFLSIFSALRFQTGQDWYAYEEFFNQLDTHRGLIEYFQNGSYSQLNFEFGFYLVNYFIKSLDGSYFHVLAFCSVVSGASIYLLYREMNDHIDFAVVSYIGYAYLLLGFAQARQGLGLAFFIFALVLYLRKNRPIVHFFGIALFGVAVQYSVAIYLIVAMIAYTITRFRMLGTICIAILFSVALLLKNFNTNLFQIFMLFAFNDTIADKVNIYEAELSQGGILNFFYSLFLLVNALYIYHSSGNETEFRVRFLLNLTAMALYLSFLIVFVIPGLYPLYSRVYILASISLPVAFYFMCRRETTLTLNILFVMNYIALTISYFRLFYLLYDEYIPYQTWLF